MEDIPEVQWEKPMAFNVVTGRNPDLLRGRKMFPSGRPVKLPTSSTSPKQTPCSHADADTPGSD